MYKKSAEGYTLTIIVSPYIVAHGPYDFRVGIAADFISIWQ